MHRLLPYLPQRIARAAVGLPEGIRQNLTEIRLRLDGPVSATSGGKNRAFNAAGAVCAPEKAIICTKEDISECISLLTKAGQAFAVRQPCAAALLRALAGYTA